MIDKFHIITKVVGILMLTWNKIAAELHEYINTEMSSYKIGKIWLSSVSFTNICWLVLILYYSYTRDKHYQIEEYKWPT